MQFDNFKFKKMNRFTFTKFLLILALMASPFAFYGQENDSIVENKYNNGTFKDYVYVTGDFGLGFLSGDNSKLKMDVNGHVGFGYQFDNILGVRANLGYGSLNGTFDNLSIDKMNYFEANINLTISLTDIIFGYNPERLVNFVPHIGIGQVQYKVTTVDNQGNTLRNIDERSVVATIPMGAEVNFRINDNWKVYLDFIANYADTELLDGVHGGVHNDWFSSLNLGVNYRLGDKANIFRRQPEFCNYWFLAFDGGASLLNGDNKYEFKDIRGNFNVGVGYNFHNYYRVYGKLGYGIYSGSNSNYFVVNYADYFAANVNVSADVIGLIFGYKEARKVSLYPHIGLGQIQYRARATYANGNTNKTGYEQNSNTKGDGVYNRRVIMTVPVGIEFTYNMNEKYDIYADFTSSYADSDFLDCYASGKSKDWLNTFNLGVRYKFATSCARADARAKAIEEIKSGRITTDDVKDVIEGALEEQSVKDAETIESAVSRAAEEAATKAKETTYNNNFTNIVFPINEAEKLDTQTNIDALNRAAKELENGCTIVKVVVEGFTSPDGSENDNQNLAKERANAAAKLVKENLNIEESLIEIVTKGPDWEGLFNAIEGSDLENKDELVKQIKESNNREQTLRNLISSDKGLGELLPQLRRAAVTITTVKQ